MNLIRAFLAVEIPVEIQGRLKSLLEPLARQQGSPVRWVKAGNIHLTLKFFGDTDPARLERLAENLEKALVQQPAFELQAGGFGAFPNLNRPRVFWCGLSVAPELKSVQAAVESVTAAAGFPAEGRPFSPHLTIGRSREGADPGAILKVADQIRKFPREELGTLRVDRLIIFRSQLVPGGSIYTPLFEIPFGGDPRKSI